MEIQFVQGKIDLQNPQGIDAVVCPTDTYCSGSGGLDYAVHKAAGPGLKAMLKGKRLSEGEVLVTGGFDLGTKCIVHAAVPKNNNPAVQNPALVNCYRNVLMTLGKTDGTNPPIRTAAITLLGTGSCGWSYEQSLRGLWQAILDYHCAYQGRGSLEQLVIHYPGDLPISLISSYTRRTSQAFFDRPMKWDPYLDPGLWYDLMYRFDTVETEGISLTEFIKEIQRWFYEGTGQWICGDTKVHRPKRYMDEHDWNVTPDFAAIAVPVLCHNLCRLGFRTNNGFPDLLLPVTLNGHPLMLPCEILPELIKLRKKGCELTAHTRVSLDPTRTYFLTKYHYLDAPDVAAYYSLDVEKAADSHYQFSAHTAHLLCTFLHTTPNGLGAAISKCLAEEGEGFLVSFLKKLGAKAYHYD